MKKLAVFIIILSSFIYAQTSWQLWKTIPVPVLEKPGMQGFGNFVPLDLDKDGMPEIVAVNNNTIDEGNLSPRMYVFKYNSTTQTWDSVWGYQSDIPFQNTWPPLEIGDMDGDGKLEVIWCPINFLDATTNPNPSRVIVFEVNSEGLLGVSDGFGGYLPNTQFTIVQDAMQNVRPFHILLKDIDGDNKQELIFADRAPSGAGFHFGFLKVSDVPDNGSGSETWTVVASGKTVQHSFTTAAKYDIFEFGDNYFFIDASGGVCHVKYNRTTQTFSTKPRYLMTGLFAGSWKSGCKVDIDNDGTHEYVFGEWMNAAANKSAKVVLVKYNQTTDSLETFVIGNFFDSDSLTGLNGGAVGDINGDGKMDFVFGTRALRSYTYDNGLYGISYLGGDITNPASYSKYKIAGNYFTALYPDSVKYKNHGQWDVIRIVDVTKDGTPEILATSSYPRGIVDDPAPILIYKATGTSVEDKYELPKEFYLAQNYPNPFNPTTNIRFYLPNNSTVDLKVYNSLGQEVAVILSKAALTSGEHNYTFNAVNLPSGIYFVRLSDGKNQQIRKITLVK